MSTFAWIVTSGLAMSAIALVGSVTLVLSESTLQRIILPLVAFAAGSLIGGAFFHMIPAGLAEYGNITNFFLWLVAGFSTFFALEQLLHWHHCHRANASCKQPLTYLILIGDGLHNFIGGLLETGFITSLAALPSRGHFLSTSGSASWHGSQRRHMKSHRNSATSGY